MICLVPLVLLLGGALFVWLRLRASLPRLAGSADLPGLGAPVTVTSDRFGVPIIAAQSRLDAFRALGYLTARDRLFHMDMQRRLIAGRVSEIVGRATLAMDTRQRVLGFSRVAAAVVAGLPAEQRALAQAYTDGVNAFLKQMRTPPPEFVGLAYRPEPWALEDTILIGLSLFQALTDTAESHERMFSVMERLLPAEVVDFLTSDEDGYPTLLLGGQGSRRPLTPIPVAALAELLARGGAAAAQPGEPQHQNDAVRGSNGWVVGGGLTADGRAIMVSDMHLPLSVPNIWYRVTLRYGETELSGLVVPGTPMVISGSNGHVAWGFTNLRGDVLDLVELEINPDDPEQYKTPDGWRRFEVVEEQIRVRRGKPVSVPVQQTIWGPVSRNPIMDRQVAVRWTALDPRAVDLSLADMDAAVSLEDALRVVQRAGVPPMNAMLADAGGRIAWTYSGKIPIRKGFDGIGSRSWADGQVGWDGFIPPEQLPLLVDPPAQFIVTANNRTLGSEYPYVVGFNFSSGYRAQRIDQLLSTMQRVSESDMFQLMLDTGADFYEFYRALALEVLPEAITAAHPLLAQARRAIAAWDGRADVESKGIAILVRFREALAEAVFLPYLQACIEADKGFNYGWNSFEKPLRLLLTERIPELLPDRAQYASWDALIVGVLDQTCQALQRRHRVATLEELSWGRVSVVSIRHPLAAVLPFLNRFLSMPRDPLPGSVFSIRVAAPWIGSALRLAVSPGHHTDGLLHIPCGQSGHPMSDNYRDQQRYWLRGEPLPLMPAADQTLVLNPAAPR